MPRTGQAHRLELQGRDGPGWWLKRGLNAVWTWFENVTGRQQGVGRGGGRGKGMCECVGVCVCVCVCEVWGCGGCETGQGGPSKSHA
jgi:hypothetical protein